MLKKGRRIMEIVLLIIGICFFVLVLRSPGKVKGFTDAKGNVLPNSIAEKCFAQINGTQMGMIIKSKDISNPVLLFVHGGPGMPEYFLTEDYPTGLEEYFTVVWWDQRGAGLSYNTEVKVEDMNLNQFVEDTIGVTKFLKEKFGKEKIYLMGHSWGTSIAIQAVQKAPELYEAYIGVGQVTNQLESEKLSYEYMLDYYTRKGDKGAVKLLHKNDYLSPGYENIRDSMMHKAGIGTMHDMEDVVSGIFFRSLNFREYTIGEKINLWRGKIFSGNTQLREERNKYDIRECVTKLEIPTYFFSGIYDYTVNYEMAQGYLEQLEAPVKGFYLFKNSAHSPMFEEPQLMLKYIKEDVLNKTNTLAISRES